MTNTKLIILAVAAAAMLAWAVVQSRLANPESAEPPKSAFLIQGVPIENIGSVILGAGEKEVTLRGIGDQFVVANKDNYPALTEKIEKLILRCLKIRTSERSTSDPKNHEALGVSVDASDSPTAVVRFYRKTENEQENPQLITGVVVGKKLEQDASVLYR